MNEMIKNTDANKKIEWIIPVIACSAFLISCIAISSKKLFWMDELVTYYTLTTPSIIEMIRAIADQVETNPPLYHIIGWGWIHLAGSSELAIRILSSLSICTAFILIWKMLCRYYGFWAASIGCIISFCYSKLILYQNAEARFYGFFLLMSVLAIIMLCTLIQNERISLKLLIMNSMIQGALVLTHYFGFLYGGIFLIVLIMRDIIRNNIRIKIYLSTLLGWALFIPWIGAFYNQANVGDPHFYIPTPGMSRFIQSFSYFLPPSVILSIIIVSLILRFGNHFTSDNIEKKNEYFEDCKKILAVVGMTLAFMIPVLVWMLSRTGLSLFLERYMIPNTIGWTIIISILAEKLNVILVFNKIKSTYAHIAFYKKRHFIGLCVLSMFIITPILNSTLKFRSITLKSESVNKISKELPVVTESPHVYLPHYFYTSNKNRYYFILDWEACTDSLSVLNATVDYKLMSAMKRHYPFHNIMKSNEFLIQNDSFLVINEPGRSWYNLRIENNPRYKCKYYDNGIILVKRDN